MNDSQLKKVLRNETDMAFRRRGFLLPQFLDLTNDDILLECGCGRGFFLNILRSISKATLSGIELDRDVVETAYANVAHKNISLFQGDVTKLPFPEKSFTKILCTEVLEHIEADEAALREIHRVLTPGGIAAISVPNKNYPFCWDPINWTLEALFNRPIRTGILSGIWANHVRLYAPEELRAKVTNAGFVIEEEKLITYFCFPFAHNIVYGVGKELLLAGLLPLSVVKASDRLTYDENPGSFLNPINFMRNVFLAIDSLNDKIQIKHASVLIGMKIRKAHI